MRSQMKMRATPQELAIVKDAINREKIPRVQKRYRILYMFLSGKTGKEIADIMGVTAITVSNIHRAYKAEGLAGIQDKSIPGRPPRLIPEQREKLKQTVLHKNPADVDFPNRQHWTAQLIGAYVEREFGYHYSIRGITRMLEHMGIVFIRPNYVLANTEGV